jgi:uncharacterized membrane protein YkvI
MRGQTLPLILLLLLAFMVAQLGFWDTLGALFGALAMIVLFLLLAAGASAVAGYLLFQRVRRR